MIFHIVDMKACIISNRGQALGDNVYESGC